MILLYVTFPTKSYAKKTGSILVKNRLCACVNILESTSIYNWKKKTKNKKEFIAVFKTANYKEPELRKKIENMHPHKIPCILTLYARPNKSYLNWLLSEVNPK